MKMDDTQVPTDRPPSLAAWRQALLFLFRVRVRYTSNALQAMTRPPCILTCNHVSMLDGVLVALASPAPMTFAVNVHHAQRHPATKAILALLSRLGLGQVVALDETRPSGMRHLLRALQDGQTVMIFPEGRISEDGRQGESRPGLQWLQKKAQVPTLSLRIRGAQRSRLFAKAGTDWWPRIWLRF